jgi:pimeloyl-ACP methyl ester carboxylesterase
MWTRFAREWATLGVPSLRLDVSGVGDSDGPEVATTTLSSQYTKAVVSSARAGIAYLRAQYGASRFVLVGLCSGAFNAFHTAAAEPEVVAAALVNPQTLLWTREMEVRTQSAYLRDSITRSDRWRRAVRGEVNVGRAVAAAGRMLRLAASRTARRVPAPGLSRHAGDPVFATVDEGLSRLASRGVELLFVYWDEDPGLEYLARHFPFGVEWLASHDGVRVEQISGAGHTFLPIWSHDVLLALLTEHLTRTGAIPAAETAVVSSRAASALSRVV